VAMGWWLSLGTIPTCISHKPRPITESVLYF